MENAKKDCCKGDCKDTMKERINYFTGRHLSARDFRDEQQYHRTHRFLHNRMLHGWGVVCGLEVSLHEECPDRYVKVSPGMAIDCCGREILVDSAICCGDEQPEIPKDYTDARPWLMLCLSYHDDCTHKVPVLSNEGDCSSATTEEKCGRYKEGWKLAWHWLDKEALKKYSWKSQYAVCREHESHEQSTADEGDEQQRQGAAVEANQFADYRQHDPHQHHHHHDHHRDDHPEIYAEDDCPHDDCGDPCAEGYRSCIAPKCPPDHCVPLALICFDKEKQVTTKVIMKGRPQVPNVPQRLTHIVDVNWPHGYFVKSSWLERNPLVVTFDRKLSLDWNEDDTEYPKPFGVNQATFVVEYGGGAGFEDLDFVPYEQRPSLIDDGKRAEYRVAPMGSRRGFGYLENHVVWVTLKCDFLLDCHGVRVDGNNNGIEGGTFESWFYVVPDHDYPPRRKEYSDEESEREDEYERRPSNSARPNRRQLQDVPRSALQQRRRRTDLLDDYAPRDFRNEGRSRREEDYRVLTREVI